jgi:UPF0755 protein
MKSIFKTAAALIAAALVVAAVGGFLLRQRVVEPFKGYSEDEQFVDIPSGTSSAEMGRRLAAAGVVRDALSFRVAVWWSRQGRALKAGEYRFTKPMTAFDVVSMIAGGQVYTQRLTFPEGLTIAEMSRLYESRGFGAAADFVAATQQPALIADLDPRAKDLEGYLFPDTYVLSRHESAAPKLVAVMVARFRSVYEPALRRRAEAEGLSTREVVTLASLVEKETGKDDERPIVAAVYRNRIRVGMGMQADPTVVYALEKAGRYDGNIHRADLAFDSPYNTYRYPGLPPGPIASPGRASLEAALSPAAVDYLYFVSRNDGSHVFARTLAEHNRNVQRFQVEYFRKLRSSRR